MAVLAIFAWVQRNEAKSQQATAQAASTLAIAQESTAKANEAEAKRQAEIASSRQYATLAWYFIDDRYDLSALFGVEAIKITRTEEAQTVLYTGVRDHTDIRYLPGPINRVSFMSFNDDGDILAVAGCKENLDADALFCQESIIQLWGIPSRQTIKPDIAIPGEVDRLLFSRDGEALIIGICPKVSGSTYCNYEVWVWDILSHSLSDSPLAISERYPIHMDFSPTGNVLAIASCREQELTDDFFHCLQSKISFFDLKSSQFAYPTVTFDERLGPISFVSDSSLVVSSCMPDDIGSGCFQSEIQIMDVRTSQTIMNPIKLGIDYPMDIMPIDMSEIYISACHQSEDLGPCAQPRIWQLDATQERSLNSWDSKVTPASLAIYNGELLALGENSIEAWQLTEGIEYFPLELDANYSKLAYHPEIAIAAAFQNQGEIRLINLGWNNIFGDLTVISDTETQKLIAGACKFRRNFTGPNGLNTSLIDTILPNKMTLLALNRRWRQ